MDGIKVAAKGRFLKVESAKSPGAPSKATTSTKDLVGKRRLFVKNIPYDAVEAELKDCGDGLALFSFDMLCDTGRQTERILP